MSDNSGPAFPTQAEAWHQGFSGLTKRELFAAMAMQGLMAFPGKDFCPEIVADQSCRMADALIAELAKERGA